MINRAIAHGANLPGGKEGQSDRRKLARCVEKTQAKFGLVTRVRRYFELVSSFSCKKGLKYHLYFETNFTHKSNFL